MLLLALSAGVGARLGRRLRLPMWPLTGAILGGLVLTLVWPGAIDVPAGWRIVAQVLVGTAVGAAIEEGVLREFLGVLVPGALAVVSIIGIGVAAGLLIGATGHLDHVSAVLGMVPGGVGEMVASATALHANVPVVASMHVVRLVISLAALPLMIRCVTGLTRRAGEGRPDEEASRLSDSDDCSGR
ncbi:AbrB family transcriptional regulator [Nocardioides koreensis]|uniref:AbrB family transcriptional regulator n=1 Tax=Nocardioides koreensis TaxID=433651 RepID=UPI0031D14108